MNTLYTTQCIMDERVEKIDRKLSVIHARVSEALENELKRRAGHLGVSVSNLVRNMLKDTVGFVEEMVDRAQAELGRGHRPKVLAWQEAVLNLNAICEECNAILPRGTHAGLGVTAGPGHKPVLCTDCLAVLTGGNRQGEPAARA